MKKKYNKHNFHEKTIATFKKTKVPNRKPDFVSGDNVRGISSIYWHHPKGVTRMSDHWGTNIGNSRWRMKGDAWKRIEHGHKTWRAGYADYKDFHPNEPDTPAHNEVVRSYKGHLKRQKIKRKLHNMLSPKESSRRLRHTQKKIAHNHEKAYKIIHHLLSLE